MELNNEMILMRKHFKNAKVRTTRKLIRHINSLKQKKGSEKQLEQNKNRIARLVEEISVIQSLMPDKIFKYLLTSNSTLDDLSKRNNVDLKERACVRIGLVPFIQQRMKEIKEKVDEFDKVRSNKEEITSLKIVEKLQSKQKDLQSKTIPQKKQDKKNTSKKSSEHQTDLQLKNVSQEKEQDKTKTSEKSRELQADLQSKSVSQENEQDKTKTSEKSNEHLQLKNVSQEKKQDKTKTSEKSSGHQADLQPTHIPSKKVPQEKTKEENIDNVRKIKESFFVDENDDEDDMDDDAEEIAKERLSQELSDPSSYEYSEIDSNAEEQDLELVLPDFYAKAKKKTKATKRTQRSSVTPDQPESRDITEVLPNVGEGYADSDEEEEAIKRRRWANFESDDDDFFVSNPILRVKKRNPAMNSQLMKLMNMNPTEAKKSEDSNDPAVRRLHNMNPIDPKKEKSKTDKSSRPGQYKFFSQFSDLRNRNGLRGWKREEDFDDERPMSGNREKLQRMPLKHDNKRKITELRNEKVNDSESKPEHLHPSWMASKKKKEQNKILQFTGTRITFDDSD